MNLKKSNREGTGKKHKCLYCDNLIPLYKKYCNRECYNKNHYTEITCIGCGAIKPVVKNMADNKYCSVQCANNNIDRKQTRAKAKFTLETKYGVSNPFDVNGYNNIKRNPEKQSQSLKQSWNNKTPEEKQDIADKISKTTTNKTPEEKQEILNKVKHTNLERYGAEYSLSRNSKIRNKVDNNNKHSFLKSLNKWLNENNLLILDEYMGAKDKEGNLIYYNFKHIPSNTIFVDHVACGRLPVHKDPSVSIGTSLAEKEIQGFIKANTDKTVICNNRKLVKGLEIDIYIPELNLAIEYNGIKWHSELNGKGRNYHLYKTEECNKQGIQLIHIFEDEWKYKKSILQSKLLNLLGKSPNKMYARKCNIKAVVNKDKNIFLNTTHIQGEDKSSIKYGLYYNDELVSIMTFGNLRKVTGNTHQEGVYELIRFSTKLNTNVVGGFSKLLKHFIKTHNPTKTISYADKRYSVGNLYINNGFKWVKTTPPNYWYMKYYNTREHRYAYCKSELSHKLEIFDANLSEWENMKLNKYDRIWDCGSEKYEISIV